MSIASYLLTSESGRAAQSFFITVVTESPFNSSSDLEVSKAFP